MSTDLLDAEHLHSIVLSIETKSHLDVHAFSQLVNLAGHVLCLLALDEQGIAFELASYNLRKGQIPQRKRLRLTSRGRGVTDECVVHTLPPFSPLFLSLL